MIFLVRELQPFGSVVNLNKFLNFKSIFVQNFEDFSWFKITLKLFSHSDIFDGLIQKIFWKYKSNSNFAACMGKLIWLLKVLRSEYRVFNISCVHRSNYLTHVLINVLKSRIKPTIDTCVGEKDWHTSRRLRHLYGKNDWKMSTSFKKQLMKSQKSQHLTLKKKNKKKSCMN